jgi:hypothetical protein
MRSLSKKKIHDYHLYSKNSELNERDFLTKNLSRNGSHNYEDYKYINDEEKRLLIISKLLSSNDYFVKVSIEELIENEKKKFILLIQVNNNEKDYFQYLEDCLENIKIIFNNKKEIAEEAKYRLIKKVWNYKYGITKTAFVTKENIWDRFLQIHYLQEIITANEYFPSSWKMIKLGINNYLIKEDFCEKQIKRDCQKCLACDINKLSLNTIYWIDEQTIVEKKIECISKTIECSHACQRCRQKRDYSNYQQLTQSLNYKFWQWFKNKFSKNEWEISSIVIMKRYQKFIIDYSSFLKEFEILDERFFQSELISIYNFMLKTKSLKPKKSINSISKKISTPSFLPKESRENFVFPRNYNIGKIVNFFLNIIGIQLGCKIYLGKELNSLIIENYNESLEELSSFIRESLNQKENTKRIFLHFNHFKSKINSFKKSRISIPDNVNWKEFCPEFEFSNYKFEPLSPIGSPQRGLEKEFIENNITKFKKTENTFNKFEHFLFHLVKIFANEQVYKFINEEKKDNFIFMKICTNDYLAIERIIYLISKRNWIFINSTNPLLFKEESEFTNKFEQSINRINENVSNYKLSIEKISKIVEFIKTQHDGAFLENKILKKNNFVNSLVGIDGKEKVIEYYHFLLKKMEELEKIPSYQELWDFFIKRKGYEEFVEMFVGTKIQPWEKFVFDYKEYKKIAEILTLEFNNQIDVDYQVSTSTLILS